MIFRGKPVPIDQHTTGELWFKFVWVLAIAVVLLIFTWQMLLDWAIGVVQILLALLRLSLPQIRLPEFIALLLIGLIVAVEVLIWNSVWGVAAELRRRRKSGKKSDQE
jgi:hypothetical protein